MPLTCNPGLLVPGIKDVSVMNIRCGIFIVRRSNRIVTLMLLLNRLLDVRL